MENEFQKMQRLAGVPVTKTKKQLDENEQKYKVIFINGVDEEDTRTIEVTANDKEDAHRKADRILHSNEYESENGLFSYGKVMISIIKESLNENFVGLGMVGNIFDRPKADYELAYEHYLGKLHEGDDEEIPSNPEDYTKQPGYVHEEEGADGEENPIDSITMDIPLFIRMLEFAREDASTDMDLHDVAEKATAMSAEGEVLSMGNYEDLVGGEAIEEGILSNIFNKLKGKNAPEEIKKEKFDGLTDEEAQKLYDFSKAQLDVLEKDRQSGRPDDGMYSQLGSMHHDNLDKLKAKYPNLK